MASSVAAAASSGTLSGGAQQQLAKSISAQRVSPEYTANCCSKLLFLWPQSLFKTANSSTGISIGDLYRVSGDDDVQALSARFSAALNKAVADGAPQPVKAAAVALFRKPMLWALFVKFINSTLQFLPSLILYGLLQSIANTSNPIWEDYVLAVALGLSIILRVLVENAYFHKVMRVGFQLRSCLSTAIYRKSLRMSPTARAEVPVGKIVNLMQLDTGRLEALMMQLCVVVDAPYQIVGYMAILGYFLGWAALAGLASMLLLVPFQGWVMGAMGRRRAAVNKATDSRVKMTNEALSGIRTLKQAGWEPAYTQVLEETRDTELGALWRMSLVGTISNVLMQVAPLIVGMVTLLVYSATPGAVFSASKIFSALSVLNQLRFPLMFLPSVSQQLADAKLSFQRLDRFMQQPEVERAAALLDGSADAHAATAAAATGAAAAAPGEMAIEVTGLTVWHEKPEDRKRRLELAAEDARIEAEKAAKAKAKAAKAKAKQAAAAGGAAPGAAATAPASPSPASPKSPSAAGAGTGPGGRPSPAAAPLEVPPALTNVSMNVPAGALYAVVGDVGAGKSSLVAALLGELYRASGTAVMRGRVAFAAQSAWVLNASLRTNVTFAGDAHAEMRMGGDAFASPDAAAQREERYQAVVRACQLLPDLAALPGGDATEIGEKGVNVSGGQKQRISLARAAYADADIVIMDDPLSALDAEVGRAVFNECIKGPLMAGKTRLLVTNQLHFLPQCDGIVLLRKEGGAGGSGTVRAVGSFAELMERDVDFRALMESYGHTHDDSSTASAAAAAAAGSEGKEKEAGGAAPALASPRPGAAAGPVEPTPAPPGPHGPLSPTTAIIEAKDKAAATTAVATAAAGGKAAAGAGAGAGGASLMMAEEKKEGAVALSVYLRYFRAAGWVWLTLSIVVFAYSVSQFAQLVSQFWLTLWSSDTQYTEHPVHFYQGIYVAIGIGAAISGGVRVLVMNGMGVRASRKLHAQLLRAVLRAPLTWYDTTPLGRILTRFSKDVDSIDTSLVASLGMLGMCIFFVLGSLAAIIFATPWFALALLPTAIIYIYINRYFRNAAREIKRFDSILRSPIFSHFSETLTGQVTIRAFGLVRQFAATNADRVASSVSAWYTLKSTDRWLSVRLEGLGVLIILVAALLAVGTGSSRASATSSASASETASALAGFSLSYAMAVTGLFSWLLRTYAETEQLMNSVERIAHYIDTTPQEPYEQPAGHPAPPSNWPHSGQIVIKDYRMRYRPNTPQVLHGLSVAIRAGMRVGIVGRTGAGKSSLTQAVLRLVTDDCHSGQIVVDGVDIDTVGLTALRKGFSIVPQDVVMFSGTIRSNLDPTHAFSGNDEALWRALEGVGMGDKVRSMDKGLDAPIAEFGANLSQGERQLLCLSRCLLQRRPIIIMDEASSSLDAESDRRIQAAIRHAFTGSTMLVVAHRLNTIIDSDAILVMDAGRCSEFGHPHELLAKGPAASIFAALVDETGPQSASALRAAAAAAYAKTHADGAVEAAAPEAVVAVASADGVAPAPVAASADPAASDAVSVSVSSSE